MEGSDSEHRPRRPRKPRAKAPAPAPAPSGALVFTCILNGGPFDGQKLMVQLPLPDELDLSRYDGGEVGSKHFYRRGRCTARGCDYTWNRAEPLKMFESGNADGA